jgi:WD40 repeat protein
MESLGASAAAANTVVYSQLPEIYGHARKVYALEFNGNGSLLASGCSDKTIRIWPVNAVRPMSA